MTCVSKAFPALLTLMVFVLRYPLRSARMQHALKFFQVIQIDSQLLEKAFQSKH